MTYPTPNVRKGVVLSMASFHGCKECAKGIHGMLTADGYCSCCGWKPERKAGDFIEKKGTS